MGVSTSTSEDMIKPVTSDRDLVELSGYSAYLKHELRSTLTVNGKDFVVKDVNYDDPTGMDAITVQNIETKEYTIVYTGTGDKQDVITDAKLLGDIPPVQLEHAVDYYNEMDEKYGISSVSGNSLAGAYTNTVAIKNPDVKAVNLNPALLPEGMVDPNKTYDNITNYFSKYDVLTKTEVSLNLGDRIPGKHYEINNGVPEFSHLPTNHTGYKKTTGISSGGEGQFYTIGVKGQPGFGKIYMAADEHIVTSIWSGMPLYGGGQTERIDINPENLHLLATALEDRVIHKVSLVQDYLGNSTDIVEHEGNHFTTRVSQLQEIFKDAFEATIGDPLFNGIATSGYILQTHIDGLISLLHVAEEQCRFLNGILNSPPAELLEHIASTNVSVESLFGEARSYLYSLKDKVSELTSATGHIITDKIPELFEGGKELFIDAVVGELQAHYQIIDGNKDKVLHQLTEYQRQVHDIASAFESEDQGLGQAIEGKTGGIEGGVKVQPTNVYTIAESPYMLERMRMKDIHLDAAFGAFAGSTHGILFPIFNGLKWFLTIIENTLEILSSTVKGATKLLLHGSLPGTLISIFTDFDDKVKSSVASTLQPLDEVAANIEGIRKGVDSLMIRYPVLLTNLKPYVDNALFHDSGYQNVHLYNVAAMSIIEEMELLFTDIVHQLSDHKADAVVALRKVSESVLGNMNLLNQQVNRGTMS
ncbi:hypothetical protein MUO14_06935 [Halobacillus shinanisalinarum]|uniref:Uncharacterized protein n=1 Tax=Halobacillus shinanisalinarum TaxID=2932258 RepID=A0ABY4H2J0_9BACI|nr:hypothetical protein [Halobacillus shinanisalinarum]UOQ94676.1 hypothetical protein MUO14_06935 [Halobacillus shinanisalinarum]